MWLDGRSSGFLYCFLSDNSEPFLPYRLEAGLLLREAKELWRVGMDLACVDEMVQRRLKGVGGAGAGAPQEETPAAVMDRYRCVRFWGEPLSC